MTQQKENPGAPRRPHGIVQDERGQDQPTDKGRAQQRTTTGREAQRDAAKNAPMGPGEPAGGE